MGGEMIAQNDFTRQWQVVGEQVLDAVRRVGQSGWYILGKEVEAFEAALAQFWGLPYAVGVGNGMDALEIGLRCLNLKPGEKVLTTPLSAFASTLAIIRAGGVPVFVDVDDLGRIDFDQCRKVLEGNSSIRFMIPVHLYGFSLDLPELARLKQDFQLRIVEDCAQSIGASFAGITAGSVGQMAATSFYPTKNLGAFGDGGALLTSDRDAVDAARKFRNYGQTSQYLHAELGLNSRLDELHAAIMHVALLPHLETWTDNRRRTARKYCEHIVNQHIRLPLPETAMNPVWHLFPVTVKEGRDALREHLRSLGILSSVHYPRIITDQAALSTRGGFEVASDLKNAVRFANTELSLPIHPFLQDNEIDTVIDACNSWRP
jgi:dTDP-4-amino-4,6-dideoxygalactose transaminase